MTGPPRHVPWLCILFEFEAAPRLVASSNSLDGHRLRDWIGAQDERVSTALAELVDAVADLSRKNQANSSEES